MLNKVFRNPPQGGDEHGVKVIPQFSQLGEQHTPREDLMRGKDSAEYQAMASGPFGGTEMRNVRRSMRVS